MTVSFSGSSTLTTGDALPCTLDESFGGTIDNMPFTIVNASAAGSGDPCTATVTRGPLGNSAFFTPALAPYIGTGLITLPIQATHSAIAALVNQYEWSAITWATYTYDPVPEPGSCGLVAVGFSLCALWFRNQRGGLLCVRRLRRPSPVRHDNGQPLRQG
ncbi:MAG: hypothetical protein HY820_29185 [Acidobacteria bacterium]|nr:hypothetical protein [Acidobacteriota bacterium]